MQKTHEVCPSAFHVSPNSLLSALFILAWGKLLLQGGGQQMAFLGEGTTARVDLTEVWLSGKEGRCVGLGAGGGEKDTQAPRPKRVSK